MPESYNEGETRRKESQRPFSLSCYLVLHSVLGVRVLHWKQDQVIAYIHWPHSVKLIVLSYEFLKVIIVQKNILNYNLQQDHCISFFVT